MSVTWQNNRYRWPGLKYQPLNICGIDTGLCQLLANALNTWLKAVNAPETIISEASGHIKACWQDYPPKAHAVGQSQPQFNSRGELTHVTVVFYRHTLIDASLSAVAQQDRLWATALHEAGHVLGLDHTLDSGAVMHRYGWRNKELNASDILAIQQRYPSI